MRHYSRQEFHSIFGVKVSNPRNGVLIGYVGDMSEFGLKIFSELPFVRDERLRMYLQVREEVIACDLNAICKWSGKSADVGFFEGGFCVEYPPASYTAMVKRLRGRPSGTGIGHSFSVSMSV